MKTQKPNIIYILADDMGYGDVSYLNENSQLHTKQIDALAKEGMVFTDAHSSSAVCTPSRYSILTGRYNWRSTLKHGVLMGHSHPLIEKDRMTVASLLKDNGYSTACIGKWHLGWDWAIKEGISIDGDPISEEINFSAPISNGPLSHGFDSFFGIIASLDMEPYVYVENNMPTAVPDHITENMLSGPKQAGAVHYEYWREGVTAPDFKHKDVLPTFTEKAIEYIDSVDDSPFFLYFPLTAPHTPILPSPEFQGKSETNPYGDFVLQCDDIVGKIMKKCEEKGCADNTIIIFTSDNGCSPSANFPLLSEYGHKPSYIFRGCKADIYEGGHRIPLIIRWPQAITAGTSTDETVCLTDLLATIADILDVPLPDNAAEDSVSNLSLWQGDTKKPVREATVHHSIYGNFSIRKGKWKLELCPGSGGWSDPRPGEEPPDAPPYQLYDLDTDISERQNVINDHPEIVKELRDLLTMYVQNGRSTPGEPQENTGAPFWEQLEWMHKEL